MSLDFYNPSVPRIFVVEAERTAAEGIVRPSYLVGMVNMATLMEWWQLVNSLEPGYAGSEETLILGKWGDMGLDCERRIELHLTANGQAKIESPSGRLKTVWFELIDLGDVFVGPAKAHVILGSERFVAGKGQSVADRLASESDEYADIHRALAQREQESGILLLGPFLTGFSSRMEL